MMKSKVVRNYRDATETEGQPTSKIGKKPASKTKQSNQVSKKPINGEVVT